MLELQVCVAAPSYARVIVLASFKKDRGWDWSDRSAVKSSDFCPRGVGLDSQHPHAEIHADR